eukprot:TRINITY_DN8967_c2_g1_i2.p1 TRINITY_DN8967_c2_g1~~TRINITY_DN8967_c2_g1_i2.p1  ORF type:complete len:531 (-),score=89.37 TRINITY_DN8967_c2_g1_i2:33-1472(-)
MFIQTLGFLLSFASGLLAHFLPVPSVPKHTTQMYPVGSMWHYCPPTKQFKDNETMIKIWYPADKRWVEAEQRRRKKRPLLQRVRMWLSLARNRRASPDLWFSDINTLSALFRFGFHPMVPAFFSSYFSLAYSNSYADAPVSPALTKYPVILFSHGLTGVPEIYSSLCEGLAGMGYIVVGIWHTDGSSPIVSLPGKRTGAPFTPMPKGLNKKQEKDFRHAQLLHRVGDVSSAVDQLKALNAGDEVTVPAKTPKLAAKKLRQTAGNLKGRMDLERGIGIVGHSFGGATAYASCLGVQGVTCGVGLDSWLIPLNESQFLDSDSRYHVVRSLQPRSFMHILSTLWQFKENLELVDASLARISDNHRGIGYLLSLEGTSHHDYNDLPFLFPALMPLIARMTTAFTGRGNRVEVMRTTVSLLRMYFEKHLIVRKVVSSSSSSSSTASASGTSSDAAAGSTNVHGIPYISKRELQISPAIKAEVLS